MENPGSQWNAVHPRSVITAKNPAQISGSLFYLFRIILKNQYLFRNLCKIKL